VFALETRDDLFALCHNSWACMVCGRRICQLFTLEMRDDLQI